MISADIGRRAFAALIVAGGLLAATLVGAPLAASLALLGASALAVTFAWPRRGAIAAPAPIEETGAPQLPDAAALLEAVDQPLMIVRTARVLYANRAARRLLGEHIEGADVRLAIRHPAAAERLIDRPGTELREQVTRTELLGLGEPDRRWEMTITLLGDDSRLVSLADKSESHASEQMRVDFVANASHELRTPLATVLGFVETLRDDPETDAGTRTRFLSIMYDEARRIQALVDDLISLSRIEAERFSVPREAVALMPLVEEVRGATLQLQKGRSVTIECDVALGAPLVLGDSLQLGQMIRNLVVNALKYGRAGTPVTIGFAPAGFDMLAMTVTDQGDGIGPEHLPRLTERFYRVDPSRSRAMGGTGLGLAIVKHIVHRHRGRLDIRSTQGIGTSVHVLLPRAADDHA